MGITDVLATLGTAGVGWLASSLTTHFQHRREDELRHEEQSYKEADCLASLYEEALFVLDRNARTLGRGDDEALNTTLKILARIQLTSTASIRDQYDAAADALDAWAAKARAAEPKRISPGLLLIRSGDSEKKKLADELFPAYQESFHRLQEMMREHIATIRQKADRKRRGMP